MKKGLAISLQKRTRDSERLAIVRVGSLALKIERKQLAILQLKKRKGRRASRVLFFLFSDSEGK